MHDRRPSVKRFEHLNIQIKHLYTNDCVLYASSVLSLCVSFHSLRHKSYCYLSAERGSHQSIISLISWKDGVVHFGASCVCDSEFRRHRYDSLLLFSCDFMCRDGSLNNKPRNGSKNFHYLLHAQCARPAASQQIAFEIVEFIFRLRVEFRNPSSTRLKIGEENNNKKLFGTDVPSICFLLEHSRRRRDLFTYFFHFYRGSKISFQSVRS